MNFCSSCGARVVLAKPEGEDVARHVCTSCSEIHYRNPVVVAGCVPFWQGRVLLCRRGIEPAYGCWTVPGGYVESGETVQHAAVREAREEANIQVRLGSLLSVTNVVRANQVHLFYRAEMSTGEFCAGSESREVRLFHPRDIPWDEIAFDSVEESLRQAVSTVLEFHLTVAPLQHSSVRPPRASQYDVSDDLPTRPAWFA